MKVSIKIKYLVFGIILLILIPLSVGLGVGYWYGSRPLPDDPSPQQPIVIVPRTDPGPDKPLFLGINDLKFYQSYLSCNIEATGPGKALVKIDRPKSWETPDKMFIFGLQGGYYCGYWLPGASLGHLWRIGSFRQFNFFLGPELSVAAYNEINGTIPVAVSVGLKMLITY